MIEQRLWLKSPHDLTGKIFRINWLFVLLLCALAAVGYVALYSAAGRIASSRMRPATLFGSRSGC